MNYVPRIDSKKRTAVFQRSQTDMHPSNASRHLQPELQALLTQAVAQMANAVMITDVKGHIVWVNDAFCEICGYDRDEVIGRTPSFLKSGKQGAEVYEELWQQVLSGRVWQGKMVDARKDGSLYTADETITALRDADGAIRHFVAVQQDVTQRERLHERERFLAHHDALTGLPNRALLHETVQKAISSASRGQHMVAVLFVDLDGFKTVNDQYGHYLGDQLLAAVAERMQSAVRQSDTIARVGGDEFVALACGIEGRDDAARLAKKLLDSFASPFVVRGKRFDIRASMGIAIFPSDGADGDTLINNADQAMYQAKLEGGHRWLFFKNSLTPAGTAAVDLEPEPPS
jgi:diguanylate cyclase (GGDEF)-like protein/PAS domain S-box-containing protein